jgi:hypothetical protein
MNLSSSYSGDESDSDDSQAELIGATLSARRNIALGKHREALLQLLSLASSSSKLAEALEDLILIALLGTAKKLAQSKRGLGDARYLFSGARRVMPRSCSLAVAEGGFLHQHGAHLEAIHCFERALAAEPTNSEAAESLESLRSFAAERWHFRMLNDTVRNASYDAAIRRAVSSLRAETGSAPLVLDIGSGTGILCLMAARAGCAHAWGVEVNTLMAEVAKETTSLHPTLARSLSIVNAHSSFLRLASSIGGGGGGGGSSSPGPKAGASISSVEIPQPVDLVVTELVDSGLVGEHMIAVLRHAASGCVEANAREHHDDDAPPPRSCLLKERGRMIPAGATLFALPIEAPELRPRQRIMCDQEFAQSFKTGAAADDAIDFDGRRRSFSHCGRASRSCGLYGLGFRCLQPGGVAVVCVDEAYTCEALDAFPHRALAARPSQVLDLDFCELATRPRHRRQQQHAHKTSESPVPSAETTNVNGESDHRDGPFLLHSNIQIENLLFGVVDAIAVWFDLILDRGVSFDDDSTPGSAADRASASEEGSHSSTGQAPILFSTAPGRPECGWDQGLYHLNSSSSHMVFTDSSGTMSADEEEGPEGRKVNLETILHNDDTLSFRLAGTSVQSQRRCACLCGRVVEDETSGSGNDLRLDCSGGGGTKQGASVDPAQVDANAAFVSDNGEQQQRALIKGQQLDLGEMDLATLNDRSRHDLLSKALKRVIDDVMAVQAAATCDIAGIDGRGASAAGAGGCTGGCGPDGGGNDGKDKTVRILELCSGYSLVGMCAALLSSPGEACSSSLLKVSPPPPLSVTIRAANKDHRTMLGALLRENTSNMSDAPRDTWRAVGVGSDERNTVRICEETEAIGGYGSTERNLSSSDEEGDGLNLDIVLVDVVEGCGLLRQGALEELEEFKRAHSAAAVATALANSTLTSSSSVAPQAPRLSREPPLPRALTVIPSRISLTLMPIECTALHTQNEVRPSHNSTTKLWHSFDCTQQVRSISTPSRVNKSQVVAHSCYLKSPFL